MCTVTPLYKKDDEFRKINYRPVTVLPTLNIIQPRTQGISLPFFEGNAPGTRLNIIFETLLSGQMYEFYTGLLSDFTNAHRKFRSCETSLLRLSVDWRMMRDRGGARCGSLYGSLQSVYVIQYPLLLSKLRAYGIDDKSWALIRNYLFGRTQRVKVADIF